MSTLEHPSRLVAYVDREVPDDEAARIRDHLAGCERCRREVEALTALHRGLEELPAPTAGDLWPGVAERMGDRRGGFRPVWAGYVAVLLLGAVLGGWAGEALRGPGAGAGADDLLADSSLLGMPEQGVSEVWFGEGGR